MRVKRVATIIGRTGRVLMIAGFGLGLVASAQAFEPTEAQKQACTPDAFRLCGSAIPDIARVTACMKANERNLSTPCKAVFRMARNEYAPTTRHVRSHKSSPSYAHYKHAQRRWARS